MNLISHLESHLGSISRGFKDANSESPISVAIFADQPFVGATTYVTIGLSRKVLRGSSIQGLRQELIVSTHSEFDDKQVSSFLMTFADSIAKEGRCLCRGEVIGPSGPVIFGTLMNSVYCTVPMVYSDSISVFKDSTPQTVFVWVIPIYEEEANFVRNFGWKAFEAELEREEADVWSFHRRSVG